MNASVAVVRLAENIILAVLGIAQGAVLGTLAMFLVGQLCGVTVFLVGSASGLLAVVANVKLDNRLPESRAEDCVLLGHLPLDEAQQWKILERLLAIADSRDVLQALRHGIALQLILMTFGGALWSALTCVSVPQVERYGYGKRSTLRSSADEASPQSG